MTARGEIKPRNSVLYEESVRKKRVTREQQTKAIPVHHKCQWKESGRRVPRAGEAEQETDVCKWICRLQ